MSHAISARGLPRAGSLCSLRIEIRAAPAMLDTTDTRIVAETFELAGVTPITGWSTYLRHGGCSGPQHGNKRNGWGVPRDGVATIKSAGVLAGVHA